MTEENRDRNRENIEELTIIDQNVIDDFISNNPHLRRSVEEARRSREENNRNNECRQSGMPENIDVVLEYSDDELDSGIQINEETRNHVYIDDRNISIINRNKLDKTFRRIEGLIDKKVPRSVMTMEKTMVYKKDVLVLDEKTRIDLSRYHVSPVVNGMIVLVVKTRSNTYFFDIVNGIISSTLYEECFENVIQEINSSIRFYTQFVAIIEKMNNDGSRITIVDCLNFNGISLKDMRYFNRLQRSHEIVSLLIEEESRVIPISDDPERFLSDRKKDGVPFFLIDGINTQDGSDFLITVARFSIDDKKIDNDSIVFVGNKIEDIDETLEIDNILDNTAPVERDEKEDNDELPGSGVEDVTQTIIDNFNNKTKRIYITGRIPNLSKADVKRYIESLGYIWHPRVNGSLDILITADNPGTRKLMDAKRLGITIMKYKDFIRQI